MNSTQIKNRLQIVEAKGKEFLEILRNKHHVTDEQQKAVESLEAFLSSGYWAKDIDQDAYIAALEG